MIPKTAFAALSILMLSAWAFGIVCDKLFTGWLQTHADQHDQDPPRHGCDNCRYANVDPREEPCVDCANGDIDRWEMKE